MFFDHWLHRVMDAALHSPYDSTPERLVKALGTHQGPILVDLDETLYLRNSTEDFLDTARPAVLAYVLLHLLDIIAPWRFTGGRATRDTWRVRMICVLMPWTLWLWRSRAPKMARKWANQELVEALRASPTSQTPILISLGFSPIIAPMLAGLGIQGWRVIAMSPWRSADRRDGKLQMAIKEIGQEAVSASLLVTDSLDDEDILERCAQPHRVVWPKARFIDALSGQYLPGQYVSRVKRPGKQYIQRVILREDYLYWVLASISLASNWVTHIAGLGLLLFSFWTIYEWGYADNDSVGARHEADPVLTVGFEEGLAKVSTPLAWMWALGSGVVGLLVLRWPAYPVATDYIAWVAVLAVVFGVYWIYNRVDKVTRIWLYAALRFLRVAAFVVVVPVSLVGAAALLAYTVSRWIPYLQYRTGGDVWVEDHLHVSWFMCFAALCILLGFALGPEELITPTLFLFLAWKLFKARYEITDLANKAERIDR